LADIVWRRLAYLEHCSCGCACRRWHLVTPVCNIRSTVASWLEIYYLNIAIYHLEIETM